MAPCFLDLYLMPCSAPTWLHHTKNNTSILDEPYILLPGSLTSEHRSNPWWVVLEKGLYFHLIWGFLQVNITIPFNQLVTTVFMECPQILLMTASFRWGASHDPGKGYEPLASESTCKLPQNGELALLHLFAKISAKELINEREKKVENGGMSCWKFSVNCFFRSLGQQ